MEASKVIFLDEYRTKTVRNGNILKEKDGVGQSLAWEQCVEYLDRNRKINI